MQPKHIGLILDGNRRFAKRIMKRPWEGHKLGLKKAREVLKWGCEKGIEYFTAYTLSLENLNSRPKRELKMILKLLSKELDSILQNNDHVVNDFEVKVRFIGRINMLGDQELIDKMKSVEEKTSDYEDHFLNLAVAYGGKQEIIDAVRKLLNSDDVNADSIDAKNFENYLYTKKQPHPDLIIRTGGEKRLSNFLTYQSAYSELVFVDKKWPEIEKKDFDGILKDFDKRDRRFGE